MKAAVLTNYKKDDITLEIRDVPMPTVGPRDVLVKTTAAGVNPVDNMISRGEVKLITPYSLPQIAGNELVGIVEQVGAQVSEFKAGDRVFGRLPLDRIGAFAQYVAVDADALAIVPDYLNDIEAAGVPLTALVVMQSFDLMNAQPGKTIFISGGTGGVGAMAIPLAKARGLKVITNGGADSEERVRALGADEFLDYRTQDYAKILKDVDYVLDTLSAEETEKQMSILKPGGTIVSLRAMPNGEFAKRMGLPKWKQMLFGMAGKKFDKAAKKYGVNYRFVYVHSDGKQLAEAAAILEKHNVKPSIDTIFPAEDVNQALDKIANGRSRGKTVLSF
ncbi:MAG: NADP-dependent oxidoreductase [Corynebacterium sp.]|nr:NADP-dependent oxidoreductase [Corynebacterium sp.]